MVRMLQILLIIGIAFVAPALGQPKEWVDDFQTPAVYNSYSWYAPCVGGPIPKYTVLDLIIADQYHPFAIAGSGMLQISSGRTYDMGGFGPHPTAIVGWMKLNCGLPPYESTMEFTDANLCIYAGLRFTEGDLGGGVCWSTIMRMDLYAGNAIYTWIDPASSGADLFSLYENLDGGVVGGERLEGADEIGAGFYEAGKNYHYSFCADGTLYGAALWVENDINNPVETLGPVVSTHHTGGLVGYMNGADGGVSVINAVHTGLSESWIIEGSPLEHYPSPHSDLDRDKDVDGFDFLTFSNCYNGSNRPPLPACENLEADLEGDGDVDGFDFLSFSNCFNGSNTKPRPACMPPNPLIP